MKLHKSFWLFSFYFFLNPLGLPLGLLYTTLLSPLAFFYRLTRRKVYFLLAFGVAAFVFCGFQLLLLPNIDYYFYFRSLLWYFLIALAVFLAARLLPAIHAPQRLFSQIIVANFLLTCLGIAFLFTPYADFFWVSKVITAGTQAATRFKMFSSEPAHYSVLIVPLFMFAFVSFIRERKKNIRLLVLISIPLALAFSLGALSTLVMAIGLAGVVYFNQYFRRWWVVSLFVVASFGLFAALATDNLFSARIQNVLSGVDSSGAGRIFQSFIVSFDLARANNLLLGVGLGQSKIQLPLFFAQHWPGMQIDRVLNAVAGTLAEFGLLGVFVRFLAQGILFFRTKVYRSYFRLALFLFIFIYQFTGSFTTNFMEYMVWLFAFIIVFPEFETQRPLQNKNETSRP